MQKLFNKAKLMGTNFFTGQVASLFIKEWNVCLSLYMLKPHKVNVFFTFIFYFIVTLTYSD